MDFLEKFAMPQSAHHMVLLKYLLVLTFILFIPYVSALFGSLSLSLYFKRKATKKPEQKYLMLAKDLIDLITFNKGVAFVLGVVPLLSSAFCYAQLLNMTGAGVPGYLLLSLLFLIIALLLIYTFKYTFHLKSILELASKQKDTAQEDLLEELDTYTHNASAVHNKAGIYGWIFLFISTYLFAAALQLAPDTTDWKTVTGIFGLIFSLNALTYYLQFIAFAFAVTPAFLLYKYFRPNSETVRHNEDYLDFVKTFALRVGLISTIVLPLMIVINVMTKPKITYSFDVFGVTMIAILLLLLISNLFYVMLKESNVKFGSAVVYLFVVVFALLILKDQYAFDTSTKQQYAVLAANFEKYHSKLEEEIGGVAPPAISGKDIYTNICSACHRFDTRLVGPPYNQTLPKYEGRMGDLVKFILNPTQNNPGYPPMPNQGLKPAEAEAVAKYIMETYKKK